MTTIFTSTSTQYVLEHQYPRTMYSEPSFDASLSHPHNLHEQHEHYLDHHLHHLEHHHSHEPRDPHQSHERHAHKQHGVHGVHVPGHGEARRSSHSMGTHEPKSHQHRRHGHRQVNVVYPQLDVVDYNLVFELNRWCKSEKGCWVY